MAVELLDGLRALYANQEKVRKKRSEQLAAEMVKLDPDVVDHDGAIRLAEQSLHVPEATRKKEFFERIHGVAVELQNQGYPDTDLAVITQVLSGLMNRLQVKQEAQPLELTYYEPVKPQNRQRRGRKVEFEADGQTVQLNEKRQYPIAVYLHQHLRQVVTRNELLQHAYQTTDKKQGNKVSNDILEIRRDIKEANVPLVIFTVKNGYVMMPAGSQPPTDVIKEPASKEKLISVEDVARRLGRGWNASRVRNLLANSQVLQEGVHYKKVGLLQSEKVTEEGMGLFTIAQERLKGARRVGANIFDGSLVENKEYHGKTYTHKDVAHKLKMKESTAEFYASIDVIFQEGEHYFIEKKGSKKFFRYTQAGFELIRIINSEIMHGERGTRKTIVDRFQKWIAKKRSNEGARLRWQDVRPLTLQEEARLAFYIDSASTELLEKYKIKFSAPTLVEARGVWKNYDKLTQNQEEYRKKLNERKEKPVGLEELRKRLEKKLLSLAQNPEQARKSRFGNQDRLDYLNIYVQEVLLAFEKQPTFDVRVALIEELTHPSQSYVGDQALNILGKK